MQSKCNWLDVEEETIASSNWTDCNFKLFMFCCDKNFYFFILENIIIQLFVDRNKRIFKILLNDIFCHKKLDYQSK